jgi:NAD(P)H-dependent FMN reductase
VCAAVEICRESIPGLQIDHVDISELPLLNTDLEAAGGAFPPAVEAFRDKVRGADCFLFASPEYNYSISGKYRPLLLSHSTLNDKLHAFRMSADRPRSSLAGPLKNALDWASRPPNRWAAAILSASGGSGGNRSQYLIRQVGVALGIHFVVKPEVFTKAHQLPRKFDDDGNLVDPETKEQVRKLLLALQAFALKLQGKPAADSE